jgi:hypothetical protein
MTTITTERHSRVRNHPDNHGTFLAQMRHLYERWQHYLEAEDWDTASAFYIAFKRAGGYMV